MLRGVGKNRENLITVRVNPDVHKDYKLAAKLKGGTMSSLIHQYIFQVIREQKEWNPEAFRRRHEYERAQRPVVTAKIKRQKGKVKQSKG